jgi:hypothetical protein
MMVDCVGSGMGSAETSDTSRTQVQTYVPAYQKSEWKEHAAELDMTLSEFVRSMVQAGRSDFSPNSAADPRDVEHEPPATPSSGPDPQGKDVENRVVEILQSGDCLDWDELLEALSADLEDRLETALQQLQREDRVRYSGRNGGYLLE